MILEKDLESWLLKLESWLSLCFFQKYFHLCNAKLISKVEIDHHGFTLGGFFISIRKVHESVRYSGVYPRSGVVMTSEAFDRLSSGKGTPFFSYLKLLKYRIMTNKEALRDLVADLQLARMRFNETVEIYPERPINHFITCWLN